ncbi:hypothetical protein BV20DRAFT_978529 [Pilatotrama ljubarskyi]|nr:hypothetical protein BV20DRAFT_978529 [Pilatotrama ljubarskyi]
MKVIYFVNRYMPFFDVTLGVIAILGIRTTHLCSATWTALVALYTFGSFLSEDPGRDVLEVTDCVASISDNIGWVFYASIIFSETTVVALTFLKQYTAYVPGSNVPLLLRTMYRDGIGFYMLLLLVSVANLLCMTIAPVWVSSALQLTLCSRVLLNLRAAAARTCGLSLDDFNRASCIAFERQHIGDVSDAASDMSSEP